jgi:hypothetical protein
VRVLRQHVEDEDIVVGVVVDVGNVDAHRAVGLVPKVRSPSLGKRAVALVEVETVAGVDVVGRVDVRPAVLIDVADRESQAVSLSADAGRVGHLGEGAVALVAVQPVAVGGRGRAGAAPRGTAAPLDGCRVEHVEVQVAVFIVVDERGEGGVARVRDPIFGCPLFKDGNAVGPDALMYVQTIGPVVHDLRGSPHGHVDVHAPVLVDVDEREAGRPRAFGPDARRFRDVPKLEVALVQVEPVPNSVAGEIEIRPSVAIQVPRRHTAAVVDVEIIERIHQRVVRRDGVFEVDARLLGIEAREEMLRLAGAPGAHQQDHSDEEQAEGPARAGTNRGNRHPIGAAGHVQGGQVEVVVAGRYAPPVARSDL